MVKAMGTPSALCLTKYMVTSVRAIAQELENQRVDRTHARYAIGR